MLGGKTTGRTGIELHNINEPTSCSHSARTPKQHQSRLHAEDRLVGNGPNDSSKVWGARTCFHRRLPTLQVKQRADRSTLSVCYISIKAVLLILQEVGKPVSTYVLILIGAEA